jgi:transcriptional regulator with XRE-family HTH domain
MMQESLAERLRVLRAQRGLSLTEASAKIGVNRHTLRDLELGKREPYGPTLRKLAEGYNVPVARLLEETVPLAEAPREAGRERTPEQRILDEYEEQFPTKTEVPEPLVQRLHRDVRDLARVPEVGDAEVEKLAAVVGEITGRKVDFGVVEVKAFTPAAAASETKPERALILSELWELTQYPEGQRILIEAYKRWQEQAEREGGISRPSRPKSS